MNLSSNSSKLFQLYEKKKQALAILLVIYSLHPLSLLIILPGQLKLSTWSIFSIPSPLHLHLFPRKSEWVFSTFIFQPILEFWALKIFKKSFVLQMFLSKMLKSSTKSKSRRLLLSYLIPYYFNAFAVFFGIDSVKIIHSKRDRKFMLINPKVKLYFFFWTMLWMYLMQNKYKWFTIYFNCKIWSFNKKIFTHIPTAKQL